MDDLNGLIEEIVATYFGSTDDLSLRVHLRHLLSSLQSGHQTNSTGPLRQALVLAYRPPTFVASKKGWAGSRADVRIELANGQVYALRVCGDINLVLGRLELAALWLLRQSPHQKVTGDLARALYTQLNMSASTRIAFTLTFPEHAAIAPTPSVSLRMMTSMLLDVLNHLRNSYGLDSFETVPPLLDTHLSDCVANSTTAIQRYLAALNQDALTLVQQFARDYHQRYDHIRAYNFLTAGSGRSSRNRVQAIHALPWLLRPLCNLNTRFAITNLEFILPPVLSEMAKNEILQAIDNGDPLFAAVSRALQLPRETVQWSHHQMLPEALFGDTRWMQFTLAAVSWVPREKRPTTDEEWESLRRVASTLVSILSVNWDAADFPFVLSAEPRYFCLLRRWIADLLQPDLPAAARRLQRMRDQQQDHHALQDFLRVLGRAMHTYGYAHAGNHQLTEAPVNPLLEWLSEQSFSHIGKLSNEWHIALAPRYDAFAHTDAAPSLSADLVPLTWPPVLVDPLVIETHQVHELFSGKSLDEEGRRLRHCVASYATKCVSGNTLIFSIRDADGASLSTLEVLMDDITYRLSLVQHKGVKNAAPPSTCIDVAQRLIDELNRHKYRALKVRRCDYWRRRKQQIAVAWQHRIQQIDAAEQSMQTTAWRVTFGALPMEP